jgi:catechol 2,3-dioxygenase-like lactoylglutathione lyase family enzyme
MKTFLVSALALNLLAPVYAQLAPPNEAGIAMGHVQLNVTDVEAQKKFWMSQFDATPLAREGLTGVKVPGMLILFTVQTPLHPSMGTVLDHFGFKVRSRDEMVKSCEAGGYKIEKLFKGSEGFPNAYVLGPDGIRVELQEDTSLKVRAVAQHLHYLTPDYLALRTWYADTFSMPLTTRGPHDSTDIPGMNLTFAPTRGPVDLTTKGGVIDHIGFEVRNLAAFCQKLEAKGVKLDQPYKKIPSAGIATAFLTDPKGVYIELTEGLGAY